MDFEIVHGRPIPVAPSYRQRTRKKPFESPGQFTAWIAGVHKPVNGGRGVSSSGWLIERQGPGEEAHRYAVASLGEGSSHIRGTIAAVEGVLNDIPEGSTVEIRTDVAHVIDVMSGAHRAKLNLDRWGAVETLRTEKNLMVSVCRCPKVNAKLALIRDYARKKRDERVAELLADGHPSAPAK